MNLEEVARLAGVSRSTVSRVVNEDRRVSDEVRARVLAIVQEHDYHPDAAGRSLATRRTHILGLLIPQAAREIFSDPFFPLLMQGAIDACNATDQNLMMLMHSGAEPAAADRLYRRVIGGRRLDGIIIAASVVDDPMVRRLQDDHYPFVLVGRHPRYAEINFVDTDNRAGAQSAVAHLLEHGYRRIGLISGRSNMIATIDRYAGYVAALQEAGLLPDPALAATGDFTQQGGYAAMRALIPGRPDAVFVASDTMAVGALHALRDAGLRVPEDIALIGFDDIAQGTVAQPSLSTVHQPVGELGAAAVRLLLERVAAPAAPPRHWFLETRLVLRRSCGCPEPAPGGDPRPI
jgi:LacI family transcriptional regulator